MAKRRQDNRDEVMLIPFLDILCSLIGVLILIIVVLCVAQTQQATGRSASDLALAQQHRSQRIAQQARVQEDATLRGQLAAAEQLKSEMEEKDRQLAELRKRKESTGPAAIALAARLRQQNADLTARTAAKRLELPALQTAIDQLKRDLEQRNAKPNNQALPIAIRPSGGGFSTHHEYFFIELSGPSVIIHNSKTDKPRLPAASIGSDATLDAFLTKVRATPSAALVFLLRDDGWPNYNRAAGYAESRFGLLTSKLPLPGTGELDLGLFSNP